jgi:hypothetical protein
VAVTDIQAVVSIQPRGYFDVLNDTLDYSYLATPLLPGGNATAGISSTRSSNSSIIMNAAAFNGSAGNSSSNSSSGNATVAGFSGEEGMALGANGGETAAGVDSGGGNSTQIVRRVAQPNARMPVYVNDVLAWGSPPVASNQVGCGGGS